MILDYYYYYNLSSVKGNIKLKSAFQFLMIFWRAGKNRGVQGEKIFCPRADGSVLPAAYGGGVAVISDFVFWIYELDLAK